MKTAIAFERLLVLFNPLGTNADKVEAIIAKLEKTFPGKVAVHESAPSVEGNVEILKRQLQHGDILLPCGGDGTVSTVIAALLSPAMPSKLRRTPVLPVGTGRANDIARMANEKHYADPLFVLEHGHELPVHPISCSYTALEGGKPLSWLAMYQFGVGFSGEASRLLSDPDFRSKQREQSLPVREVDAFKNGIQIVKNATYFDITLKAKRQAIIDITFLNGPIFASYYRTPVQLSRKEFCYTVSTNRSLSNTARTIFELMTNTYDKWHVATGLTFTLHDSVIAHVDGECFTPPAPCEITVSHHKEAITILATSTDESRANFLKNLLSTDA